MLGPYDKNYLIRKTLKCLDIQSIIKNYESYVINWIRLLVMLTQRVGLATYVLVRATSLKLQALSNKLQASSPKLLKHQATSIKPQATSVKLKATSNKLLDSRTTEKFQAP